MPKVTGQHRDALPHRDRRKMGTLHLVPVGVALEAKLTAVASVCLRLLWKWLLWYGPFLLRLPLALEIRPETSTALSVKDSPHLPLTIYVLLTPLPLHANGSYRPCWFCNLPYNLYGVQMSFPSPSPRLPPNGLSLLPQLPCTQIHSQVVVSNQQNIGWNLEASSSEDPGDSPVSSQSLDRGLITAYIGSSCLGLPVGHSGLPWSSGCGPDILPGYSLPLAHELNHETPHLLAPPAQALTGTTCWEGPSASALHQWRLIITSTRPCLGFPGLLNLARCKPGWVVHHHSSSPQFLKSIFSYPF